MYLIARLILEIKNGKLTGERTFSFKEYERFKDKQFAAFEKTEAFEIEKQKFNDVRRRLREFLGEDSKGLTFSDLSPIFRDNIVNYTTRFLVD